MKIVAGNNNVEPPSLEQRQARKRGVLFGAFAKRLLWTAQKTSECKDSLAALCGVEYDREVGSLILKFTFDEAVTTIRIVFNDEQSGADMVITNMTTLPDVQINKGFGSTALKRLIEWAHAHDLRDIQAVQVQAQNESFWIKNAFVALRNPTNDFRYVHTT